MNSKDFRRVLWFMCNRWNEYEAYNIFGSLGNHIWGKWQQACEFHHGPLNGIAWFMLDLDDDCVQKLINRSLEYYSK